MPIITVNRQAEAHEQMDQEESRPASNPDSLPDSFKKSPVQNPTFIHKFLKFAAKNPKDAIKAGQVSDSWQESVREYSSGTWQRLLKGNLSAIGYVGNAAERKSETALKALVDEVLIQKTSSEMEKTFALAFLGHTKPKDPEIHQKIADCLRDPEPLVVEMALRAHKEIKPTDPGIQQQIAAAEAKIKK